MADKRKVFPVEKVLELVTGKNGADVKEIAGYILGETVDCDLCAKTAAPFAAAWLARWYPRFVDLTYKEGESWQTFVNHAAKSLGDNVSITPMDDNMKAQVTQVLRTIKDTENSLARQTAEVVELEKRIKELQPLEGRLNAAQKKNDELENKIKAMKADAVALQRKVAEFQGKMPIDHDALMDSIKSAIKDGLKGATVAGAAATGAPTEAQAPEKEEVVEEFGFGSSGADNDGFGF